MNNKTQKIYDKEKLVDEVIRHDFDGTDEYVPVKITETQIEILKAFINTRFQDNEQYSRYAKIHDYWNWTSEEKRKQAHLIIDLRDFALRVLYDEIDCSIVAEGIEDSTQYLLENMYDCKSNNDYDLNYIWNAINKEIFLYGICNDVNDFHYIDNKLYKITGR